MLLGRVNNRQYGLVTCRPVDCAACSYVGHCVPHAGKADPLAETYDEQQEREWLAAAARLTEKQLREALEMATRVMGHDARLSEGALLSGMVQAMAINLSTVRRKR